MKETKILEATIKYGDYGYLFEDLTPDSFKLETDEDRLRVCLDVVIPMMRTMEFADNEKDLLPENGPQVCFAMWMDEKNHEHIAFQTKHCGTFGCLGGWYYRVTGERWWSLQSAWHERHGTDICCAAHKFSNGGTAREELEARAAAIAKAIGR